MALGNREKGILAAGAILLLAVALGSASTYFTPVKGSESSVTVLQLILVTLAGNWNPAPGEPVWNTVTATVALLLNGAQLVALFGIFKYVYDQQKERTMKVIDLLEIFDTLVTAKVSSAVSHEFKIEGDEDKVRLQKTVSKAVKDTKALWEKNTVPTLLQKPEVIDRWKKSLDEKY